MNKERVIEDKYLELENTYTSLPQKLFSSENPDKVPVPKVVMFNEVLAKELGIDVQFLKSKEGVDFLSGNRILSATTPIAQAYAGHQFGYFTMLGDGRAVLLGEYVAKNGERVDIQLKGAGRTQYSRGGDGKAALGPMLREYIISEAMNALGIDTTRSLAVVTTGEEVIREKELQGSILTRVAKSHIRVGTFQFISNWGTLEELKELADYSINRHFKKGISEENPYIYLLHEVVKKQADLIAKWQLVGFIHGVMNTDNMVISGETIDYGPCAFMDVYDTNTVFSSIDTYGRYAYGNQPQIGAWNLARFAETLLPLLHENQDEAIKIAQDAIENYMSLYKKNWHSGMRRKLGLFTEENEDEKLIEELLFIMQRYKADYTNTFCDLTLERVHEGELYESREFKKWYELWQKRLTKQSNSVGEYKKLMEKNNPTVIPRNYRVEESLKEAVDNNDYSSIKSLLKAVTRPYDYSNIDEYYTKPDKSRDTPYRTYCGT
ncbi:Uncharacterized conserved protein YdiU, UPF0061 family [Clostridium collagenovorans DSM 3089]|uniref:Protein nucleotidyltransferase YdiU n=1 Tax=Clostridium collagenovorans DSM 3089 TaxID=1121306 RepID=A0A1M5UZB3_9CLOT|nr:YdiU family protein [Clostridium collagenovorans]SHH68224.1 Uncharacterized conserved protein YdiU, UPF0061 family [Clostridium collagenovorans DSM 3089]